jgi:hypothetical protein
MKYVMKKVGSRIVPIVFGEAVIHCTVARREECRSAGFVEFVKEQDRMRVRCFGRSESLRLESKGATDELVLSSYFRF